MTWFPGPNSMSPAFVPAGQAWQVVHIKSIEPSRASVVPPSAWIPWKLRTVPTSKMSYQPPVLSVGTVTWS